MLIFQFHHYIKPEFVEAYKAAILANVRETVKEPGIIRFEVFQDKEDPAHFSILEIYQDETARELQLETPHFLKFKEAYLGQEMGARKGCGNQFEMLFLEQAE
ncbi:MAG: antibiotic biosynthesis monooxygenase [Chloroflexi bacterium]|nr:antibiotic biosynthesis monooxygenase [Chloroflexota bacterium]MBU1661177.1 antibiotic biosynthesis monooxygenase [Chloroflexota bacterium]